MVEKKFSQEIGYFIGLELWELGVELLEYQLNLKKKNRHFNTLSMFYYENLSDKQKDLVKTRKYFQGKVANNLFYGLKDEFKIHAYPIPKTHLGLRKYTFLSYPMRVVYYAISLYFVRLTQEFLKEYYFPHKQIHSNYGGNLLFEDNTETIKFKYNSIWYKPHYKRFRRRVRSEIDEFCSDKVVIHVDIQNFYEEISVPILVKNVVQHVKPSIQREMSFDLIAQGQIIQFFEYLSNGKLGIPQTDNDVTSSFLAYLYLAFGDLLIDQEIRKNVGIVDEYSIIRYIDDIYISIKFKAHVNLCDREIYVNSLMARLADCMWENMSLRFNTKTRLFWLENDNDRNDLLKNLKRTSPEYEIVDDEDGKSADPAEKIELIFKQLEKLKRRHLDPTFNSRSDLDEEILKDVYDEAVQNILKKSENTERIRKIFKGFNFDLVVAQPREILVLILYDECTTQNLRDFLYRKTDLNSRESYLLLSFLCQTGFEDKKLIRHFCKHSNTMSDILQTFLAGKIPSSKPGYFELDYKRISKISIYPNVLEQMRLRIQAEHREDFSVALNHLLNEFQAICFRLQSPTKRENQYKATDIQKYLREKQVPHETCVNVRNFFDRRNKNPVSHADPIAWLVTKEEYFEYYRHVGICLQYLL